MAESPSIFEHWLGIVKRRWALAAAVWLAVVVTAAAVLWVMPRQFESKARFLVKNARQDLVVGPNEDSPTAYRDEVSEEIINTELEFLRSRDILARVVRELNLDKGYIASGSDPAMAAELAIRDLGASINSETIRKTNLIQVSYMNTDAAMATTVLKHLADAYLAAHLVMHSSPGTYELFRAKADEADRGLGAAQDELAALARSANLVVPEEQKRELMTALTAAETQYSALQAEMHDTAARVQAAERRAAEVPQRVTSQIRNLPNQDVIERLTTVIVELTNKRTELLTKFNPEDRFVQEVDRQIADTRLALEAAKSSSVNEESTDVNPTYLEIESESMKAQIALAGLSGKAAELSRSLAQYRARALELAEASPQYEAVARRVAREQANYQLYSRKAEEARIVQALDTQRISNVVLAQAPFVSAVPAKPDVRLGMIVGISTASLLAACAALAAEHFAVAAVFVRRRQSVGVDADSSTAAALS